MAGRFPTRTGTTADQEASRLREASVPHVRGADSHPAYRGQCPQIGSPRAWGRRGTSPTLPDQQDRFPTGVGPTASRSIVDIINVSDRFPTGVGPTLSDLRQSGLDGRQCPQLTPTLPLLDRRTLSYSDVDAVSCPASTPPVRP